MSDLKTMPLARSDLVEALLNWRTDTKVSGHKIHWPEKGIHAPDEIFLNLQDAVCGIDSSYRSIIRCTSSWKWTKAMHPEQEPVLDQDFLSKQLESIRQDAIKMGKSLEDGTDSMLENSDGDHWIFSSWHAVCAEAETFARNAVILLVKLRPEELPGLDVPLLQAIRALGDAGTDAMVCRKRLCSVDQDKDLGE
jgi:hypothetical protein